VGIFNIENSLYIFSFSKINIYRKMVAKVGLKKNKIISAIRLVLKS
jgi:hypothetical protein